MMYIIDAGRDETVIHRIDYVRGVYYIPKKIRGFLSEQAKDLIWMAGRDKCDKIIFNEHGIGVGLKDRFIHEIKNDLHINMDFNGNIIHSANIKDSWEL